MREIACNPRTLSRESNPIFFSVSLFLSLSPSLFLSPSHLPRIRGLRTYRPHRCPQCDGGIDLKVHSCFHNAVSVPTFKLTRLRATPSLVPRPRPPSTPRNPWHAAYTTRAWVATTLPSARRPIRLPPDFQSFHSTILSCFRSDLSVHLSVHRPSARPPSACLRTFYSCSRSLSFRLSLALFSCIDAVKSLSRDSADG